MEVIKIQGDRETERHRDRETKRKTKGCSNVYQIFFLVKDRLDCYKQLIALTGNLTT